MKALFHKPLTAALLLTVFTASILFSASPAEAKWNDNSDDLPGFVNITPYLIVGGVLIGGIIAYKIFKPKSDNTDDLSIPAEFPADEGEEIAPSVGEEDAEVDTETDEDAALLVAPEQESRLGMFFDVTDDRALYGSKKPSLDFSDLTVRAGVTIGF